MLPRSRRLTRRTFQDVLSASKRKTSAHFSVSIRKSEGNTGSCAAVVSKKVAKSSVERHLLKRRMLVVAESFSNHPVSFILYARTGADILSFPLLKKELNELLSDATREV